MQALNNNKWMTGFHRINTEAQLREYTALWIRLQGINLTEEDDNIRWNLNANDNYSAKSAYLAQFRGSHSLIDFSKLWKAKVQPKCKFFTWLWLRQRILTDDMLQTRGIDHGDLCSLCDQEPETATHMVLQCPYARTVWFLLAQWTGTAQLQIQLNQFNSPADWW